MKNLLKKYWLNSLIILVFATFLSSCLTSILRVSYNNFVFLALFRIDTFFDIDNTQKVSLKKSLQKIHYWHRKKELKAYQVFLNNVLRRSQKKQISSNDIQWMDKKILSFFNKIIQQIYPACMPFLKSLSKKQIKHLKEELKEANKKYEEYLELSNEEFLKKRTEKILDRSEIFVSSLTKEQKKVLTPYVHKIPNITKKRLFFRKERQRLFLEALEEKELSPKKLKKLLFKWTQNAENSYPPFFKKARNSVKLGFRNYILKLWEILNESQRKYFYKKIKDYSRLIESLK